MFCIAVVTYETAVSDISRANMADAWVNWPTYIGRYIQTGKSHSPLHSVAICTQRPERAAPSELLPSRVET